MFAAIAKAIFPFFSLITISKRSASMIDWTLDARNVIKERKERNAEDKMADLRKIRKERKRTKKKVTLMMSNRDSERRKKSMPPYPNSLPL